MTQKMPKRAQSLCPVCLRRLDAVYERADDAVLLRKTCPEHGEFAVPVWRKQRGAPEFADWSRPKRPSYPKNPAAALNEGCPFDCGLCPDHGQHTCTGLIEVTLRCDMGCPVCYASAGSDAAPPDPDLEDLAARLSALHRASGSCNLQISGGEPTLRTDLPEIIRLARGQGFGLVQLNSNGLNLAGTPVLARELKAAGLDSVYLQWDGASDASFRRLRGRDCLDFKRRAVEHCAAAGLGVVLVATVVSGVNDGELGDLLRLALRLAQDTDGAVRGLHLQPAAFFGRYPWPLQEAPRLTLPELMSALARQAPELVRAADFHPPGCEHELCSFSAVYRRIPSPLAPQRGERAGVRGADAIRKAAHSGPGLELLGGESACCDGGDEGASCCCTPSAPQGLILPMAKPAADGARAAKQFTALHWKGAAASVPASDDLGRYLAENGPAGRFTLSAMAFQDAMSVDIERLRGCCIHVVRKDGRLIPFCLHNLTAEDGTRLYGMDA